MKHNLTLYVGDKDENDWLIQMLDDWSMNRPDIEFMTESVHINPSKAVQLRLTQLPALIFNGDIIVQGDPITWVPHFLDQILFGD